MQYAACGVSGTKCVRYQRALWVILDRCGEIQDATPEAKSEYLMALIEPVTLKCEIVIDMTLSLKTAQVCVVHYSEGIIFSGTVWYACLIVLVTSRLPVQLT